MKLDRRCRRAIKTEFRKQLKSKNPDLEKTIDDILAKPLGLDPKFVRDYRLSANLLTPSEAMQTRKRRTWRIVACLASLTALSLFYLGYRNDTFNKIFTPSSTESFSVHPSSDDIPDAIPGAKEVIRYPCPDAKYLLVRIKQSHLTFESPGDILDLKTPEKMALLAEALSPFYKELNAVQMDIGTIITYFTKTYGVVNIRAEGVFKDLSREECRNHYMNRMSIVLRDLNIQGVAGIDTAMPDIVYAPGAALFLGMLGKINVLPATHENIQQIAEKVFKGELPGSDRDILLNRELSLLDLVTSNNAPFSLVVYGGEHKFNEVVHRWNEVFPGKTISLIDIIPSFYTDSPK
ncbi:hypothetical protein HYV84_06325 [Candidatus Woesearchaeota archaeon]|nr:hypothetical protein [Candidatus Woesearchaeota archaeon]